MNVSVNKQYITHSASLLVVWPTWLASYQPTCWLRTAAKNFARIRWVWRWAVVVQHSSSKKPDTMATPARTRK